MPEKHEILTLVSITPLTSSEHSFHIHSITAVRLSAGGGQLPMNLEVRI
jgi:hypothetical protein